MKDDGALTNMAIDLMAIVRESAEDLVDVGGHTHDFRVYACFERYGVERLQLASELRRLIGQYGGHPPRHDGICSVKRLMSHVRMALPHGERAIVVAFQKSEDQLIRQIEDIIGHVAMESPLFDLLGRLQANIARATEDLASLSLRLRYA
jgi:predicted metal-dependent hydrolase